MEIFNLMCNTLSPTEIIALGALLLNFAGLIFAGIQLMGTKKLNRACLVKELYYTLYNDIELRKIFYRIEWSVYDESSKIEYGGSEEEQQLDKLLSFFDSICNMYYLGVLKKKDLELFSYEMERVYVHPIVQNYFKDLLDDFQRRQMFGESYVNFKRYCFERLHKKQKNIEKPVRPKSLRAGNPSKNK